MCASVDIKRRVARMHKSSQDDWEVVMTEEIRLKAV